jgi:putative mRNA 3-end processing factor
MPVGQPSPGTDEDTSPVTWRDGAHIRGTSIWCDARRARDVCFVSSADRLAGRGHGQLIATAATLALITRSRGVSDSVLAVPYGRPFTLGTRRLELICSGAGPGAASLLIEVDGKRVLYAGAVNPHGGGLAGPADTRSCDTLIIDASYGDPRFEFPGIDEVTAETIAVARATIERGAAAVLLVHTTGKGIDVAGPLVAAGLAVRAHRSIHHAAQRLRREHQTPAIKRWSGSAPASGEGFALLWPVRALDRLDRTTLPEGSELTLLSGDAVDPRVVGGLDIDRALPWSARADYRELLDYIESTGATRIYLTDRYAEALAETLDSPGRRVEALGPPRQMSLF